MNFSLPIFLASGNQPWWYLLFTTVDIYILSRSEMSLIVQDFTTFLYGGSYNSVFFSLILATLRFHYIYSSQKQIGK